MIEKCKYGAVVSDCVICLARGCNFDHRCTCPVTKVTFNTDQ